MTKWRYDEQDDYGRQFPMIRYAEGGCRMASAVEIDMAVRIAELETTIGTLKTAFRVNMLRRAMPGEDIDAEIDRVFAELEG